MLSLLPVPEGRDLDGLVAILNHDGNVTVIVVVAVVVMNIFMSNVCCCSCC